MVFSQVLRSKIQPTYQSKNLVQEFYEPILSEANIYRRVSAYFSSEGLALYSKGLDKLFDNNGFAHLLFQQIFLKKIFLKYKKVMNSKKL